MRYHFEAGGHNGYWTQVWNARLRLGMQLLLRNWLIHETTTAKPTKFSKTWVSISRQNTLVIGAVAKGGDSQRFRISASIPLKCSDDGSDDAGPASLQSSCVDIEVNVKEVPWGGHPVTMEGRARADLETHSAACIRSVPNSSIGLALAPTNWIPVLHSRMLATGGTF